MEEVKAWHVEAGSRWRSMGDMERVAVEEGSKPRMAGVRRALRFCVIESSVVARERRRKSMGVQV